MIGSAVTGSLLEAGAEARAHAGPAGTDTAWLPDGIEVSFGEITDGAAVAALVAGADVVVHLAGPASVAESFADPSRYARDHVQGTATVLQACIAAGVGRIVHISSAEIYGRPAANPVAEDASPAPRSPYGAAKLGAEAMVRACCPAAGMEAVVLRPFSVYGPRSPERSLVGRLLRQALGGGPVRVATLRPVRDYVHVDDVAASVRTAIDWPGAAGAEAAVFNVGSGTGISVAELAQAVLEQAGIRAEVQEAPVDRPTGSDITELVADLTRTDAELGWRAAVSLHDGLAAALAELRAARAPA
jgi:UDP-glucose 4-epimerase